MRDLVARLLCLLVNTAVTGNAQTGSDGRVIDGVIVSGTIDIDECFSHGVTILGWDRSTQLIIIVQCDLIESDRVVPIGRNGPGEGIVIQ